MYGSENDEFTDPNNGDSDDDGLNDFAEINNLFSNPKLKDTDEDGLEDLGKAIAEKFICDDYSLTNEDTDGDGTEDGDEDLDGDGLTNIEEITSDNPYGYYSDAIQQDTDRDGLWDGDEIDPWNIDNDGKQSIQLCSLIQIPMTHEDGFDYEEVLPSNNTQSSRMDPREADTDDDGVR